jgi:hypothetical protein
MRRLVLLLTLLTCLAVPAAAAAQDSDAPRGADPSWLPNEEWVNLRWLPWDEDRLYRLLRTDRGEVFRWVRIDAHNSLWRLARRKGVRDLDRLAARLVEPRRRAVGPAMTRVLQRRARRTLTQAHLGQHLLFHDLHQTAISDRAERIFGVPRLQAFYDLRRAEVSPLQIGELFGRSRVELAQGCVRALRDAMRRGIRKGAISRGQAELMLGRQLSQVPRWLGQNRYNGPTAGASRPDLPPGDYANRRASRPTGRAWPGTPTAPTASRPSGWARSTSLRWTCRPARAFGVSPPEKPGSKRPTSAYNSVLAAGGRAAVFETAETSYPLAKRVGQMSVVHRNLATGRLTKVSQAGIPATVRTRTAFNPSVSADGTLVAFEASDIGRDGRPGRQRHLARGRRRRHPAARRPRGARRGVPARPQRRRHAARVDRAAGALHADRGAGPRLGRALGDQRGRRRLRAVAVGRRDRRGVHDPGARPRRRRRALTRLRAAAGRRRDPAGQHRRRLRAQPAVSGDGARVAFVARRQTKTASILGQRSTLQVADVAGGRPVTAFAGRGWSTQPALSRDGGRLVATTTAKVGAKPFGLAGVIVCDLRAGGGARLISTHRRGRPAPKPPHADHGGGAGHDHG